LGDPDRPRPKNSKKLPTDKAKILKKNNKQDAENHVSLNASTIHAAASSNSLPEDLFNSFQIRKNTKFLKVTDRYRLELRSPDTEPNRLFANRPVPMKSPAM
jgi:hypothetical protein